SRRTEDAVGGPALPTRGEAGQDRRGRAVSRLCAEPRARLDLPPHRHRAPLDCRTSARGIDMIALDQLNALPPGDFVAALAGIFEHSPWVAERVQTQRPFASRLQLLDAMRAAVHDAPLAEQLSLIRAHPKL